HDRKALAFLRRLCVSAADAPEAHPAWVFLVTARRLGVKKIASLNGLRAVNFKRYRDLVIVLLALAVPFWFLRASMRDPNQVSGPDRVLVKIATPIQYAAATLARGLSDVWGDYIYLVDVKEDNARLASENA